MKTLKPTLLAIAIATCISCTATVTTNTLPDGTVVTVESRTADPIAVAAALEAARLLQPAINNISREQEITPIPSSK